MEIQQDKQQKQKIFKDGQDFIQKQKQWLDLEQQEEIESHKKLLEENSPLDLQQLGMAIVKMKCKSIKQGLYGRILLTFTHPNYNEKVHTSEQFAKQVKLPEVKIQAGDNIAVYKAMDGFLSKKPVVSGIVYRKNQYKIVLSLEDFKNNVDEFFDKNYVNHNEIYSIVIEVNEITYNRQMSTLQLLEEVQQDVNSKQRHLCDILFESNNSSDLNKLNPHVKRSQILKYDPQNDKNSQQINWRKKDLNDEQKDAIKFCLSRENIGLIHGPPGTGKTMTVCELIYQAAKSGLKVLACSGSNIAVDNMVERIAGTDLKIVRIGHPARLLNSIKDKCLDAQIRKTSSYKILKDLKKDQQKLLKKIQKASTYQEKKALKSENFSLNKEIKIQERQALKEVAEDSQVICCTNTGAGDKIFKYELKNTIFDLVVIDEAAQSMEISCWLPILKGKRVVLAGDHKQLPPTVKSNNKNLSLTLFDRVLKDFEGAESTRMLKLQYRMNEKIMEWSSQAVYEGQLKAAEMVKNHSLKDFQNEEQKKDNQDNFEEFDDNQILMFIDTAGAKIGENEEDFLGKKQKSKSNKGECDLTKLIIEELIKQGIGQEQIGIITPYNAQVEIMRKTFEQQEKIEISTVDGFQGREKECIIISMVRSNPLKKVGFLSDYRRMNVAVTRAKRFVCLIGDSDTISSDKFLKEMFEYFTNFGEVRSAFEFKDKGDVAFNTGFISVPPNYQQLLQQQKQEKNKLPNQSIDKEQKEKAENQQEKNQKKKKNKKKNKNKENDDLDKNSSTNQEQKNQIINNVNVADIQVKENEKDKLEREKLEKQYSDEITAFLEQKDQSEKIYEKLNGFQRFILHDIAEKLGVNHVSQGSAKLKNLVISKKNQQSQNQSQDQQVSKKDNQQQKSTQIQQDDKKQQQKQDLIQQQQQQKKKKNKKKQEAKKKEEELDDMAFLEAEIQANKFCSKQACKQNVEILGVNCKFCGQRFCMKHSIAEQHGCDKDAKVFAKKQFQDQQRGKLAGKKYVTEQDKEFLRQKLLETVEKTQQQRLAQQKKEDKKK